MYIVQCAKPVCADEYESYMKIKIWKFICSRKPYVHYKIIIFFYSEIYTAFSKYEVHDNKTINGSNVTFEDEAKDYFYLPSHMYKQPDYRYTQ